MIVELTSLSLATARKIADKALDEAAQQGLNIAVCIVDVQGHTLVSARMETATPPILNFAEDKAYTAATMRRATEMFAQRMSSSASLTLGLSTRPRLLAWGGGLPIVHDGNVIGGIGVSGASDVEDVACAQTALRSCGLGWET
jgi:uncharacterized protein GlcG (DUF336 family)